MNAAPLRVGFLFNESVIVGGGERSFIELADAVRAQAVTPVAVMPGEGEVAAALRARGVETVFHPWPPIRARTVFGLARQVRETAALFRRQRLRLVHANGARCMLYAGPAARRAGLPCVWHVRVLDRDRLLDRLRARWAARTVANSRAVADTLRGLTPRAKPVEVIYNGFDIEALAAAPALDLAHAFDLPAGPVVLAVGRLCRWKGYDDFVRACAVLTAHGLRAAGLLVGDMRFAERGCVSALQALAAAQPPPQVRFAGRREDVPGIMKAASVLVVPSHGEPFGRVIVEAWACGLPVVATRAGGPAELIADGVDGLLVEVGRPDQLADAAARVLTDPALAERLRAAGRRRATEFTLAAHAERMAQLYRALV